MDQVKIGKFIAELRKNKNMTQQELGDKLNVSFKTLSKWENGRGLPELSTLKPLSEELGVSINEILSGEKLEKQDYQEKFEENIVNTLDYSNKKIKNIKYICMIFIICTILVLLIMFTLFGIDITRMRNNEPIFFSNWGFNYVPPINLDDINIENAIKDYLIREDEKNNHYDNEKSFVAMRTYLIDEKSKEKYYVYAWVLQEKYYLYDSKVTKDTGSSIPYKFEISKTDDTFIVENFEIPRDGSYYNRDMKHIFPNSVLKDIDSVYSNGTIEKLSLEIKNEVNLYFHD